jgi:hypothetical protein
MTHRRCLRDSPPWLSTGRPHRDKQALVKKRHVSPPPGWTKRQAAVQARVQFSPLIAYTRGRQTVLIGELREDLGTFGDQSNPRDAITYCLEKQNLKLQTPTCTV